MLHACRLRFELIRRRLFQFSVIAGLRHYFAMLLYAPPPERRFAAIFPPDADERQAEPLRHYYAHY